MTLSDILERCETLEIKRKKKVTEDYLELVILKKDIRQWNELLTGMLGEPIKPASQKPSGEAKRLTKKFGGIRPDQTLFRKKFDSYTILGMLWPWRDKKTVTLKIPVIKDPVPDEISA